MKRLITSVIVMVLCTHVMGQPYQESYYPPPGSFVEEEPLPWFPEDQGWERYETAGGADRTVNNGVFVLSTQDPQVSDQYLLDRQELLDAGPGEFFFVEWRMRLLPGSGIADVTVFIARDAEAGEIDLGFSSDHITSYLDYNRVDMNTTEFHTYAIESYDMLDYYFYVDGQYAYTGFFDPPGIVSSWVVFGDCCIGQASSSEWDYFRFGVARLADFDTDGNIDLVDFITFASCFGSSVSDPVGSCADFEARRTDLDRNGVVDLSDFVMFASAFGT